MDHFGTKLGPFWGDFGPFLGRSGFMLGSLRDHFGIIFGGCGVVLTSFWGSFLGPFCPFLGLSGLFLGVICPFGPFYGHIAVFW